MQEMNQARFAEGDARMNFLPMLFSSDFLRSEVNVYHYAERFLEGYKGGFWEFVQLPNGGGFMQPPGKEYRFQNPENWTDMIVSAEAAGIILTALVLNHRSWMFSHHDQEELCTHFCERYEQLMAYADTHTEGGAVFRALD
ncbi:antirestriction protein [Pantoea ananatis]